MYNTQIIILFQTKTWYQIFLLQKSQLLIVSSPVSQDKAYFDSSSDELETYCSSETFHSVNTSPIQKKQASLQRVEKYHLQRKSLEVWVLITYRSLIKHDDWKLFCGFCRRFRQGERRPRILQGLEWSKVGFKNEMVTKCKSNKFHKEYMDKQNFYKLEFWIVLQVYGALNLLSTENLSNKKNSPVLFSDLKAIKGHSFSLPLMSCGLFVLTYMMFSGILWIAF